MEKERKATDVRTQVRTSGAAPGTEKPRGLAYNTMLGAVALAAAVLFAVLFGVGKGVRSEYRQLDRVLAQGSDGSGYGVSYYEGGMEERAANLCKIAGKSRYNGAFTAQTDAVRQAIQRAGEAQTAGALYDAVQDLIQAVDALNEEMADAGLDESDEAYRASEYQNFTDQLFKLRNVAVDYNEQARDYNQNVLASFPASALKGLLGLPEAEEFS